MRAVPLHLLLDEPRAGDSAVAWDRQGTRSWEAFTGEVGGLARRLEGPAGARFLLDVSSSYAFAVGLYAAARVGGVALVPPNRQPGTLRELAARCDAVLHDAAGGSAGAPPIDPLAYSGEPWPGELDPERPVVQLFTSGTTGSAKEIPKALRHLGEVEELERRVGADLPPDVRVYGTAPHQHLYGLLLRVLWPLATGRPFQGESLLRPEELLPRLAEAPSSVLVATPAHLRHLTVRPELRQLRGRVRRVLSSGGPLAPVTAAAVEEALGAPPLEMLGSTETGGVATRTQPGSTEPGRAWVPLGRVQVRQDPASGRLRVASPFVSVGAETRAPGVLEFEMGDRAEVEGDGSFVLRGRADRVVKIGEKRLSLPDMESRLREHVRVDDCALVDVDRGAEARVAAVVALSPEGRAALAADGRRELVRTLQTWLATHWDRVMLPRVWRFVPALPADERGKLTREALLAIARERPRSPETLGDERDGDRLARRLRVPADLAALEGHFPGHPVVPGAAQVGWALAAAEELAGHALRVVGVEALKFKEMLLPGAEVLLELELDRPGSRVRFTIAHEGGEHASGRLLLGDPP